MDHAAVLAITKMSHTKPEKRKIHLWKKADMEAVRRRIDSFSASFHAQYTSNTPIQELWSAFSKEVMQTMIELVPSKLSTTRHNQAWVHHSHQEAGQTAEESVHQTLCN